MLRIGQVAVRAQQVGHAANLAPAHGVGLPGQRERTGAGPPDVAAGQVQVDQCGILGGAADGLVQALAIETQRGGRCGKQARRQQQITLLDAADLRHPIGRVVAHGIAQRCETVGVAINECGGCPAFPQHGVQHAVEERHVGAGLDRQVQVGGRRGIGAARVAHDDLQVRVRRPGVFYAPEQHGMGERRVRARDEDALGMVDVFVTAWRRVGTQGLFVARHSAAHAQAGVGVDVVGADQALGKLVEDVVVLREQLA